jgi:hypothetical protein
MENAILDTQPGTRKRGQPPFSGKRRLSPFLAVLLIGLPTLAGAQAIWQPTPTPTTTAENETWYRNGEPILWGDEVYYQVGAPVFFNRYQMVRSGAYRGVPLYTDSTHESLSIVYLPVAGGLMQPYERRRTGALAGTTGNRGPSFPVGIASERAAERPVAPEVGRAPAEPNAEELEAVAATGRSIVEAPRAAPGSVVRPKGINGVWITYEDQRWFASGKAVRLDAGFKRAGSYQGFPVYRHANDDHIYIPTSDGMIAPYGRRPPEDQNDKNDK